MVLKSLTALAAGAFLASTASANIIVVNDFEAGATNTGGGPNNGGLQFFSVGQPSFTGNADFTPATATSVPGLNGSTLAGNFVVGLGPTYDGILDIPSNELQSAGVVFTDPSLITTISFDYELGESTTTDSYNGIVGIANTDNTDGNSYSQGANGFYFGSGAASGTASFEITDLLAALDPAVNPGYSSLRLLSNKDGNSSVDITLDNITITQVPEPASLALVSAGALAMLRRRK